MIKTLKLFFLLALVILVTSACSVPNFVGGGSQPEVDRGVGGIFVSGDRGDTWRNMALIPTITGQPRNFFDADVNVLVADPSDSKTVYLGTFGQGLYYTYSVASGWNEVSTIPKGTVNAVAVDPKSSCRIYVAIGNVVYRSDDCNRSYNQVYLDNNLGVRVKAVVVDHYNNNNVYIATSRGEIIKSIDGGVSWRTIHRLGEDINYLLMSPLDSRFFLVASVDNNLYSFNSNSTTSSDLSVEENYSVTNWRNLSAILKDMKVGNFRDLHIHPQEGLIVLATDNNILRSKDNGISWEDVNLIPPEKDAVIKAIALNPQDASEMTYVTHTTIYRSFDGGVSWNTRKLPTVRPANKLLMDAKDTNILYLGLRFVAPK